MQRLAALQTREIYRSPNGDPTPSIKHCITADEKHCITADDTERRVARALRICVGNEVRKLYGDVPNEPIPSKIADLLHRLD
jgi:hypothetical protein